MVAVRPIAMHTVGLAMLLAVAACGGGGGSGPAGVSRDQRRAAVIDGNGDEITGAVRDVVNVIGSGRDRNRIAHSWNGNDLSLTILGSDPAATVSLSSRTDAVGHSSVNDSPVRGTDFNWKEFDVGKTKNGRHTIGRIGVDWNKNDVSDHFAYGYWLTVSASDDQSSVVDTGAFVKEPEFQRTAILPSSGYATYRGRASGLHTVNYVGGEFKPRTDEFRIGEFEGDVVFTAYFGYRSDAPHGTIWGNISNITTEEEGVVNGSLDILDVPPERPFAVYLIRAPIDMRSSSFSGEVEVVHANSRVPDIVSSHGRWEGTFSSRGISERNPSPRLVGGTFGAEFTFEGGTVGQYIGSFRAADDS